MAGPSLTDILAGRSPDHRVIASPSGTRALVLQALEAANSQWVEAGTLYDTARMRQLAAIGEWNWHVDSATWSGDDRLSVALRRFPGDAPGLALEIDVASALARPADTDEVVPLDGLSAWLERWYAAHRQVR